MSLACRSESASNSCRWAGTLSKAKLNTWRPFMKNTPSLTFRCGAPEPSVPNLALPSCQVASSPIQVAVAASPNNMVVLRSSGSTIFEYGSAVTSRPFFKPVASMKPLIA
ncbi:hypothetical protein D3C84_1083970 [compost metagenome]